MLYLLKTNVGRLRLLGLLEGVSLLVLLLVAVPAKYLFHNPALVRAIGPVHGAIFLLFAFNALRLGVEQQWSFKITRKLLLACFIPFGTFYIDHKILRHLHN